MARKKSYNPFKMWGSYVGALILAIPNIINLSLKQGSVTNWFARILLPFVQIPVKIGLWLQGYDGHSIICSNSPLSWLFDTCSSNMYTLFYSGAIIGTIILTIIGFLIGWGIHSLIRRFK